MFCDNCGAKVDDDAVFCAQCGQQLLPQKVPENVPPPTRAPQYMRRTDPDHLCFGEQQEENPYVGGIILICIGLFLAVIFFDLFSVEIFLVLVFFAIGAILIIQALRKGGQGG